MNGLLLLAIAAALLLTAYLVYGLNFAEFV